MVRRILQWKVLLLHTFCNQACRYVSYFVLSGKTPGSVRLDRWVSLLLVVGCMCVRADREGRLVQSKGFTRSKMCRGTTFQSHTPIPHLFNGEQNRHATLAKNFNRGVARWRGFEPQCELLPDKGSFAVSKRKLGVGRRRSKSNLAGRVALHRLDQSIDGIAGTHGTGAS